MAMTRRHALKSAGLAALGAVTAPLRTLGSPLAATQASDADLLVVVFARGGYDALNMVIPYGSEQDYFARRPRIAIPAPDAAVARRAVDLDGFFGLHPSLAERGWKDLYDAGLLAIVHAAHVDDPTRSHFDASAYMEQGLPGRKNVPTGWLGRHLDTTATATPSPFRAVGMGAMLQASLRGPQKAVTLQSISDFRLMCRSAQAERFAAFLQTLHGGDGWLDAQGRATFSSIELLAERIGPQAYQPANGADYSTSGAFGQYMRQLAQLVKADMGLDVACVDIGGWDTHAGEVDADDPTTGALANQLSNLAAGLFAFVTDLQPHFDPAEPEARGIVVAVMSEFGRRANENGALGTDHGHGNVLFVLGKGILGGKVYTRPWPGLTDEDLDRGDLAGTVDYRDVLAEILDLRLGNPDPATVLPDWRPTYLGLARARPSVPTPVPTRPTAEPTRPAPGGRLHLPWSAR